MTVLFRFCPPGIMVLIALLAILVSGSDMRAQPNQPPQKKADKAAKKADEQAKKANEQGKKANEQAKKAAKEMLNASLADALLETHILLASASFDYGGHKGKAMNGVHAALNLVNANTLKDPNVQTTLNALKAQNAALAKAMAWEGRRFHDHHQLSDYQMVQAAANLGRIHGALVANQKPVAAKHVQSALESINTALTVEAPKRVAQQFKGKEALALAEAWLLLAAADYKDAGHRLKAMNHFSKATTSLDANLAATLPAAENQQLINRIRDNNAALAASLASEGDPVQIQRLIAELQVFEAAAIAVHVGRILTMNNQQNALGHLENALKEMDLSLATRK